MGGQGALLYAARHPGMFRAAAAYSGSAHPLLNDESVNRIMGFFAGQGNDPLRVWGDPIAQRQIWEAHDPCYLAHQLKSIPVYLSCGDGTAGPFDQTVRVTTQRCGEIGRVRVKPWFSNAAIGPVWRNEPDTVRSSVSSG